MGVPLDERFDRPSVMGVVNVTPDSFSDGGLFVDPRRAAAHAELLAAEGAAIVDLGGESTRPGASPTPVDVELERIVPVLERLGGLDALISIDTSKAAVARAALALGASMVNDITALRADPAMADVVGESGAYVCIMHMQGDPRTMQIDPTYDDVVVEVRSFLEERLEFAVSRGISEERVCVDPGIGFGKTVRQNLELIARLDELVALGRPVLVGASRKSFLGRLLGDPNATKGPLSPALAVATIAYHNGATIVRAHDVREHVQALRAAAALEQVQAVELS